jgi:dUTP pyrophosphatase
MIFVYIVRSIKTMQKMKIVLLHPKAVIPKYQTEGAAGFDLHAVEHYILTPGETILVSTGIAVAVPKGFELQIRPRSGLSLKTGLRVANAPGTVDEDYRGEIKVIMQNTSNETAFIAAGDRIAQGVVCPVVQVEFEAVTELDETERGSNGFGSTGN